MNKLRLGLLSAFVSMSFSLQSWAGGLLTNTNTNIAFNRNFARDGVIAIDGVYSNPAGVAFLADGFHLSLNNQSPFQTRTIQSGITVPAFAGTAFEHPFALNGGNADGIKEFKGEANVPFIPSFQAAYNFGRWGIQASFSIVGGGGQCTFDNGLASFERPISLIPSLLYATNAKIQGATGVDLGLASTTPGYSVESYLKGKQFTLGFQLGATYKINEHIAVYAGARFNHITNKYEGSITNITASIAGENQNLYDYFGALATNYQAKSEALAAQAQAAQSAGNAEMAATLQKNAALCSTVAQTMEGSRASFADRYFDCTQSGWGVQPIIGFDYKGNRFNIGTRLEFTNHLNFTNKTKRDDTGLFPDGAKSPGDMPGIFTLGGMYEILPNLRGMASFHYFFDKDAKMSGDKQKLLEGNTIEMLAGVEWDITDRIMVSAGGQRTNYGLGDGAYLTDISFTTDSYSAGFGAKIRITEKVAANVAYFWTMYDKKDKAYDQTITLAGNDIATQCTDQFTRTNRVFGVGIDIDF